MVDALQPAEEVILNGALAFDCEAVCNPHMQTAQCQAAVTLQTPV